MFHPSGTHNFPAAHDFSLSQPAGEGLSTLHSQLQSPRGTSQGGSRPIRSPRLPEGARLPARGDDLANARAARSHRPWTPGQRLLERTKLVTPRAATDHSGPHGQPSAPFSPSASSRHELWLRERASPSLRESTASQPRASARRSWGEPMGPNPSPVRASNTAANLYGDFRSVKDGLSAVANTRLEEWTDSDVDAWELAYDGWRDSYEAEVKNFPSLLLYTQMKLEECFQPPAPGPDGAVVTQQGADPFRIAVACKLHEQLVLNVFGRYSEVMTVLHTEMLKGIYPRRERLTGWQQARRNMLGRGQPYCMEANYAKKKVAGLLHKIRVLEDKDNFIKDENVRRAWAIKFTVLSWWWKCVAHMMTRWRLITDANTKVDQQPPLVP